MDATIRNLMAGNRGILAADESVHTINARFQTLGIDGTVESRRRYRQLLFATAGLEAFISGVIMFDETSRQRTDDDQPFVALLADRGIVPGIKVDIGAVPLAGTANERVTEGLDHLRSRLQEYRTLGMRFAKWRAVFAITSDTPSRYCLQVNAHALARFAALCQAVGMVPIVEPEVLMDGTHSLARAADVAQETLTHVFAEIPAIATVSVIA